MDGVGKKTTAVLLATRALPELLDWKPSRYERKAEALCQAATDGRLADTHQADKHNWTVKVFDQFFHDAGLYIRGAGRAKALRTLSFIFQSGVRMPRGVIVLIILLIVLIGGAILVSRSVTEQPTKTIEVEIPANATPR